MTRARWVLLNESSRVCIAKCTSRGTSYHEIPCSADDTPEHKAKAAGKVFSEANYQGEPVVLGIGANDCLAAAFPHEGRRMARDRKAMSYALEEFLPLAAEDSVADYIVFNDHALGIAIEIDGIKPLVASLQDEGIRIQSIVPVSILAIQQHKPGPLVADREVVAWQNNGTIDVLRVHRGKPELWRVVPAQEAELRRELELLAAESTQPLTVVTYEVAPALVARARELPEVCGVDERSASLFAAAEATAQSVLSGKVEPLVDLARDGLKADDPYRFIRTRMRLFIAASLLFLLCSSASLLVLSHRYEQRSQTILQEQERLFRRVFPGQRIPVGIRARLESELRKLAGKTGRVGDVPRLQSAVALLHQTLQPLPDDLRFRLLEIRVEREQIQMDGEARNHGDADRIANALRVKGLHVEPAHTQQLATRGISFNMVATVTRGEESTDKRGPSE